MPFALRYDFLDLFTNEFIIILSYNYFCKILFQNMYFKTRCAVSAAAHPKIRWGTELKISSMKKNYFEIPAKNFLFSLFAMKFEAWEGTSAPIAPLWLLHCVSDFISLKYFVHISLVNLSTNQPNLYSHNTSVKCVVYPTCVRHT